MTLPGSPWMHSGARPRRLRWWLAGLVVVAIVFALGVALGQALEENPDPNRAPPQTYERTFTMPLEPATGG